MKKILGILIVCLLTINIMAQTAKVFEGYGKLPWGSSIETVKNEYANLYEETSVEDKKNNERLFYQENETTIRFFRFYNEKLYWARIVYVNPNNSTPNNSTTKAIADKLLEQYGRITGTDVNEEGILFWWEITPTFTVWLEFREYYNAYGRKTEEAVFVTNENPKIRDEITKIEIERKKKELEF